MPNGSDRELRLEVERKKPRLAWQGMERREVAPSVPAQVVEIVRPGRAVERKGELGLEKRRDVAAGGVRTEEAGSAGRRAEAAGRSSSIDNRLIWTNDNLVALQTLLDERDPKTRDFRYRGKVDLVYIDPPFMVNSDFLADNSIDIELDEKAHVEAKKEPSLVEILAYKDTWRQGLDSFLSMLRARLLLLKELLAPTGSIYVHLDWHAVHYVKVLMDELFGYESFRNEIVWQRSSAHSDSSQGATHFGRVSESILFYAFEDAAFQQQYQPYDEGYISRDYRRVDLDGRRYRIDNVQGPGGASKGNPFYEFLGVSRYWRYSKETMDRLYAAGRIIQTKPGAVPQYKRYLDEMEGIELQNIWTDLRMNNRSAEVLGYPTQKPVALVERIISASCPPGGLVLDCFLGSGTTAEAAERLGRRWIGIDNGKYAIHLARKRLIQLHGQPRPPEKPQVDYVECKTCKAIERKEKPQKSPGPFQVRPFTVENMGVYQRTSAWEGFQQQRSAYRDEMIRVFGGEPVDHSPLLHGRKGSSWVHVGPLDAPVASAQVWAIAREAKATETHAVTILSADFDAFAGEKDEVKKKTGVSVTIRVIPASAIDEVKRRLDLRRAADPERPLESTAIPAFYAPLSIVLEPHVSGRDAEVRLSRCEVDIESFLASQRPLLKPITDKMSAAAKKKAQGEVDRWEARERELQTWLQKATSWKAFVDFWAVDWSYGREVGEDDKPIFVTEWQSFRSRGGKAEPTLAFEAKFSYAQPGRYRIAARVTDVFGNDGIATVDVEVKR